ncbi:MAG TPA: hypothetical protein VJA47_01095 [archaeon]|nr:hypothetical protein [archaeon]
MNVEMVFIFVFVIIVVSFVLVMALNLFGKSTLQTCLSGLEAQANTLTNEVSDIYLTAKGSEKNVRLGVDHSCVKKVCFFNPDDPSPNPPKNWEGNPTYEPVIQNQRYNIGFILNDGGFEGRTIDRVQQQENFCIETSQQLRLINNGPSVDIALPPEE